MSVLKKILVGATIMIGVLVFLLAIQYGYYAFQNDPEVHIIPEGYRGPVVILYDWKNGSPPKYEDGARIYEMPHDGVLRTQFAALKDGNLDVRYYYRSSNGELKELPYMQQKNQMVDSNQIYVFMRTDGVSTTKSETKQRLTVYMVGKVTDDDQEWFQRAMKVNKSQY